MFTKRSTPSVVLEPYDVLSPIPNDTKQEIFSFMDAKSFLLMRRVSSLWKKAADEYIQRQTQALNQMIRHEADSQPTENGMQELAKQFIAIADKKIKNKNCVLFTVKHHLGKVITLVCTEFSEKNIVYYNNDLLLVSVSAFGQYVIRQTGTEPPRSYKQYYILFSKQILAQQLSRNINQFPTFTPCYIDNGQLQAVADCDSDVTKKELIVSCEKAKVSYHKSRLAINILLGLFPGLLTPYEISYQPKDNDQKDSAHVPVAQIVMKLATAPAQVYEMLFKELAQYKLITLVEYTNNIYVNASNHKIVFTVDIDLYSFQLACRVLKQKHANDADYSAAKIDFSTQPHGVLPVLTILLHETNNHQNGPNKYKFQATLWKNLEKITEEELKKHFSAEDLTQLLQFLSKVLAAFPIEHNALRQQAKRLGNLALKEIKAKETNQATDTNQSGKRQAVEDLFAETKRPRR